jgi:hypothetical protein
MNGQLTHFCSLLYASESSRVALCLLPPHPGGVKRFTEAWSRAEQRLLCVGELGRFVPYARYRNARGWSICMTPSVLKPEARDRRKESFAAQQEVVYLDCDEPSCVDRIRERCPFPTLVVRTSRGRQQVYWRLAHPVCIERQEQLMSHLALELGADRAATDVSRVFRLPGFWNRKPDRNNTVDIVFTRGEPVAYESLCEVVPRLASGLASPAASEASTRGSDGCCREAPSRRQPGAGRITASERDWYEVHRRLAMGERPWEIIAWLQRKRVDKRNPRYYAERTVFRAMAVRQARGSSGEESGRLFSDQKGVPM